MERFGPGIEDPLDLDVLCPRVRHPRVRPSFIKEEALGCSEGMLTAAHVFATSFGSSGGGGCDGAHVNTFFESISCKVQCILS